MRKARALPFSLNFIACFADAAVTTEASLRIHSLGDPEATSSDQNSVRLVADRHRR